MRRAEWRGSAGDPAGLLGWWWRGIVDRRIFVERQMLIFATMPFVASVGVGLDGGGWGWLVLAALNFAFAYSRPYRGSDELRAILPDPPPPGQFRAEVVYSRGGLRTGTDEMGLMVVEGWLVGEGVRSSFALGPKDVVRFGSRKESGVSLDLADGSRIHLTNADLGEWYALTAWRGGPEPKGEPMFPPVQAHPQEVARWSMWFLVGVSLLGLPAVVASLLHLGGRFGQLRVLLECLALGFTLEALRNLRRLGRITTDARRAENLVGPAPPLDADLERTIEGDRAEVRDTCAG